MNPRLLALAAVALLVVAGKKKGARAKSRRDVATLVGLATWRPARRHRLAVAVAAVIIAGNVYAGPRGLVAAIGGIAAVALAWPGLLDREAEWRYGWRTADRFVLAAADADLRAAPRLFRSPYPTPTGVHIIGPNVRLAVRIPAGMDVAALAGKAGAIGAALDAQGLVVRPDPDRPMAYARVDVLYRRLAPGRHVELVAAPDVEHRLDLGEGLAGPVTFDLDDEVHAGVFGPSGAGKGVLARWLTLQALDPVHGRRVVIIDGQGSPEWRAFAGVPGVTVAAFDVSDPAGSLAGIDAVLEGLLAAASELNDLCAAHRVDGWRHLPAEVRAGHPRVIVVVDELTALVGRTNDTTATARKALGYKLGTALRTVRKSGMSIVLVDQVTYAGADQTYLPPGSLAQLGRWVCLGTVRPEVAEMIAGIRELPYVADQPGLACTGRRVDPYPEPIEIPFVDRGCLTRTLEAWATATPTTVEAA